MGDRAEVVAEQRLPLILIAAFLVLSATLKLKTTLALDKLPDVTV
jgi:hypothetical protein